MKSKSTTMRFRVHTAQLLEEIVNCSLPKNSGILYQPLNHFKALLAKVAERAAQLNDPILNECMFDLTLYELPIPTSKEYGTMMKQIYSQAATQRKKESKKSKA